MKRLILLPAAACLLTSCMKHSWRWMGTHSTISAAEIEQRRQAFVARIAALPSYLVHNETPVAFRKRLQKGNFHYVEDRGISYLYIGGDGTFGRRVFIGYRNGKLDVNILEGKQAELYRYNELEQCLEQKSITLLPLMDYDFRP